ncbi:MAG: hypothetical protein LQ351_003944 [Letrouitia transgressa]|nr:MAG: hypothetical protein LQ351_003944 [Letrouitia transgressa]
MATEIYTPFYKPKGVTEFLGLGTSSFIGIVDEATILKYAKTLGDKTALALLDLEAQILTTIGPHRHIVSYKGKREDGLLLERAQHGSIAQFLREHKPTWQQRLIWARQVTEAIAATHKAGVNHCDISVNNLLLDDDLTVKLCDFQGRLLWPDGSVNKDGLAAENTKSFMPRADPGSSNQITDLFALGSAFYHIMQGHEPFPDMDPFDDEEQIQSMFASRQYPEVESSLMNYVIHKCWGGEYTSAEEVLQDLGSHTACVVAEGVKAGETEQCTWGTWETLSEGKPRLLINVQKQNMRRPPSQY